MRPHAALPGPVLRGDKPNYEPPTVAAWRRTAYRLAMTPRRPPRPRASLFITGLVLLLAAIALLFALGLHLDPPVTGHGIAHAQDVPPAFLGPIAAGPDGNLWFTETEERHIGRITPAGHVTAFPVPRVAGPPSAITRGPDGNLWFTAARGIGRITVSGHVTFFRLPRDTQPGAFIISGSDGNLWFTTAGGNGIVRMTVAGRPQAFHVPEATSLAPGSDGNLWFTEPRGDAIGRMTLAGRVTEFALPRHKNQDDASGVGAPITIAAGSDGNLWFTEFARRLGSISPQGRFTEFSLPDRPCCIPFYITPGPDGNLWFTELYGNGVERITPRGHSVQFVLRTPWSGPLGIAAGADGNLWVTATCSNKVVRITPHGHTTEFPVSARHGTGAYCFRSV